MCNTGQPSLPKGVHLTSTTPAVDQSQGTRVEFQQADQLRRRATQHGSRPFGSASKARQHIQDLGQQPGKSSCDALTFSPPPHRDCQRGLGT